MYTNVSQVLNAQRTSVISDTIRKKNVNWWVYIFLFCGILILIVS